MPDQPIADKAQSQLGLGPPPKDPLITFTICEAQGKGKLATKVITPNEISAYGFIKLWRFLPLTVRGLDGLMKALVELSDRPREMVIRGQPLPDDDALKIHSYERRWVNDPTLKAVPRNWIALDFDDVYAPGLGGPDQIEAAGYHVRDVVMGGAFEEACMVASATSSTGRKGPDTIRLRLWGVLAKRIKDEDLVRWAKNFSNMRDVPMDFTVLQTGQPIYTARPLFRGLPDPVPHDRRVAFLRGRVETIALDADQYLMESAERTHEIDARFAMAGNWRAKARAMVGSEYGFFEPLSRVIGAATQADESLETVQAFIRELLAEKADPKRQAEYGDRWVRNSYRRFASRDRRLSGVDPTVISSADMLMMAKLMNLTGAQA